MDSNLYWIWLSEALGPASDCFLDLLERFKTAEEIYRAATGDKKRSGGSIDVVVLESIGKAKTVRLDMDGLRTFVEASL